ncbi:MAG TPA: Ig-like domain-containing protein [Nocardioidaceae bacterium]|nr:Ig-like domain-containing protein [Nocardioidaceae bacterium]
MRLTRRRVVPAVLVSLLFPLAPAPAVAAVSASATCAEAGFTVEALHGPRFYVDLDNTPPLRGAYAGYRVSDASGAPRDDLWVALTDFAGDSVALGQGQPTSQQIATLSAGGSASRFFYLTASHESTSAQTHQVGIWRGRPELPGSTMLCATGGGFGGVDGTIKAAANKLNTVTVSTAEPLLGAAFEVTVTGETGTIGAGTAEDPQSFWMSPAAVGDWPASAYRLESTSLSFNDGSSYQDTLRVADLTSQSKTYTAVYRFRSVGFTTQRTQVLPVQQIASGTQIKHTDLGSVASLPAIEPAANDLQIDATVTPEKLPSSGGQADMVVDVTGSSGSILDGFEYAVSGGTSVVPGSAQWNDRPADDPVLADGTLYFQGPFELTEAGGRLEFSVDVPGTSGRHGGSFVGRVGDAQIDTTLDMTDDAPARMAVDVNTAPTAANDDVAVMAGGSVTVQVLANDADPDADPLTVTGVGTPASGSVVVDGTRISYTPAEPAAGEDSFSYTVSDGRGGTATATVHLTMFSFPPVIYPPVIYPPVVEPPVVEPPVVEPPVVEPPVVEPPAPEARDDRVTTTRAAGAVTVPVTANDTGTELVVDSATARHGKVTVTAEGVRYAPAENFTGVDEVTYVVSDAGGRTATATLTVVVRNKRPTLPELSRRIASAGGSVGVALDPHDADGDRLRVDVGTVTGTRGAARGVHVTPRAARRLLVEVDRSFSGRVSVPVTVRDGHGGVRSRELSLLVRPRSPRGLHAKVLRNPAAHRALHHPRFRNGHPVSRVLSHRVDSVAVWRRSPTASVRRYDVFVNGELACHRWEQAGRRQSCKVRSHTLRHGDRVNVVAIGPGGVRSVREVVPVPRRRTGHLLAVVYFPVSKFFLDQYAVATLRRVATQADRAGYDVVRMAGHTDSDGGRAFNRRLSQHRAHEVRRYLLRHSDALSVPVVSGHGESRPARPNTTRRGKAANRRVEIYAHR